MPLIEKHILIEGDYGQTIRKSYYVNEKPANPYAHPDGNRTQRRTKAAKRVYNRKVSVHKKGYTWSMGYNHCVGRYSGDIKYSRFGGSSLNRSPQLKLYEGQKDVYRNPDDPFEMAMQAEEKFRRKRLPVPL